MEVLVRFDRVVDGGVLRLRFVDDPLHWIDVSFAIDDGRLPAPRQVCRLIVPACKHHGEVFCRCPFQSRAGAGIELRYAVPDRLARLFSQAPR
jgi:hypothetical protein